MNKDSERSRALIHLLHDWRIGFPHDFTTDQVVAMEGLLVFLNEAGLLSDSVKEQEK